MQVDLEKTLLMPNNRRSRSVVLGRSLSKTLRYKTWCYSVLSIYCFCFGFLYKFDIYIHKWVKSIVFTMFIKFCDESSPAILNIVNVFSRFPNYLPLEKDWALYLNKLESPAPKDALCQVLLKVVQWFWRRTWKCGKFTTMRMTMTTTDNQQLS